MARELAPEGARSPDTADLAAVVTQLEDTTAGGDPKQAKALLRLLIKELRVNRRSEILPTYRVLTYEVCATPSSVGRNLAVRKPAARDRRAVSDCLSQPAASWLPQCRVQRRAT
jgi:hypothetical protein